MMESSLEQIYLMVGSMTFCLFWHMARMKIQRRGGNIISGVGHLLCSLLWFHFCLSAFIYENSKFWMFHSQLPWTLLCGSHMIFLHYHWELQCHFLCLFHAWGCMGMHVLVESLTGGGQDLSTFTWRNWYVQAKHSYQKKFLTKLLVWILALLILLLVGIGFYKLVVFLIDKY